MVRLNVDSAPADVYLKLENLQPTGSFKIRGVSNALAHVKSEAKTRGVYTCSAGNMAQALAWESRKNGIECTVVVPDNAPETKLQAVKRFGAEIIQASFDEVWKIVTTHEYPPLRSKVFIHPFANADMIMGNGTIGLEILDDLPDVDSVVIPFGGGGLATGIATAVRGKKSVIRAFAVEPETAAPLAVSFKEGYLQEIKRVPSFVDGIGGKSVLPEMWKLVRSLLEDSIVMPLRDIASAGRLLAERNRIVAEGAGAASVAAALSGKAGTGKVVCVVSGGNIDSDKFVKILQGEVPK
ncbi:MAG TPA: pyridoxal-phosphate dependent enzyme [Candidatus Bathyarchaeia archaeon]|nr:pyridoxal-phosphate dependent enzyme [Candidatus Bathyarchaeia archaeon]